jgi:hypothetical protein
LDEIAAAREAGSKVRGYAFYHMQDAEAAVDEHALYLAYGAAEPAEAPALRIANEIIDALARHGLKTEWDGSWQQRIRVRVDWKRRLAESDTP